MTDAPAFWAVIPAAGVGSRMQSEQPKQYLPLNGKRVIEHTVAVFLRNPRITGIVIAFGPDDQFGPGLVANDAIRTVTGGADRAHSVMNALDSLVDELQPDDFVLVHDAARPCLSDEDLNAMLDRLAHDTVGGLLGIPVRDTLKLANEQVRVSRTVERSGMWHAHTPQMFRFGLLRDCLARALEAGLAITDEASALESQGYAPTLMEGSAENIKITYPRDLLLAEAFLRARSTPEDGVSN